MRKRPGAGRGSKSPSRRTMSSIAIPSAWLTLSYLTRTHTHNYFSVIHIRNLFLIESLQLSISRGFIPKSAQLHSQVLHGRGRSQHGHTGPELE